MGEVRQWVGIDVRQAKLDIALRPSGRRWQVSNNEAGWQELVGELAGFVMAGVVVESTGGWSEGWCRCCNARRSRLR